VRIWFPALQFRSVSPLAGYQYDVRALLAIRRETLNFELSPEPGSEVGDTPRRTHPG
jgi:hypothetical protein